MSFEHQDWNDVVFKKKQSNTLTNDDIRKSNYKTKQKITSNTFNNANNQKLYKIDNESESFEINKISLSLSKQIQKARLTKKLTQKELALQSNVSIKIINEYESGKAIPNNAIKMKIQKILGVILKN